MLESVGPSRAEGPSTLERPLADRIEYQSYDIVPQEVRGGWEAWILYRDVPYGRVNGHPSREAALAAAKQAIDRQEMKGTRR